MIRVLSLLFSGTFSGPHNRNARIAPILEQHAVRLLTAIPEEPGNAQERLRAAGLEVVRLPTHRLRRTLRPSAHLGFAAGFWRDVEIIRRVVRERRIDAILINGAMHPHGAIAGRREGVAVIWQIIENLPGALKLAMTPLMLRYADVVMSTGMTLAASYPGIRRFGNHLVSFFPPVDLTIFRPDAHQKLAARRELGLPMEGVVIGTIGNINLDKDHRNFIRAAAALRRQSPQARFVILGATYKHHTAYAQRLWREAVASGFTLGRDLVVANPGHGVARLAQAFDIFWLTSRTEGVPTVIGEAMALELPIVATDVGAIREVVREAEAGFVVPAGSPQMIVEATRPLLNSSRLRTSLGRSGRRFAQEHFDVSICAARHLQALNIALACRPAPDLQRPAHNS